MFNELVVKGDLWWDKGLLDQDILIHMLKDHLIQDTPLYAWDSSEGRYKKDGSLIHDDLLSISVYHISGQVCDRCDVLHLCWIEVAKVLTVMSPL